MAMAMVVDMTVKCENLGRNLNKFFEKYIHIYYVYIYRVQSVSDTIPSLPNHMWHDSFMSTTSKSLQFIIVAQVCLFLLEKVHPNMNIEY